MDPTQLRDALSQHDADPDIVLGKLQTKQRARRRRQRTIGGLAAVVLVAVGIGAWSSIDRAATNRLSTADTLPTIVTDGSDGPPGQGPSASADSGFDASACLGLRDSLSRAPAEGVSVIVARGKLTGRIGLDGYQHHEMVLTHVRTLAGPKVSDGAAAWVVTVSRPATPAPGVTEGGPDGPLWGPDGALLGFYAPQAVNKGTLGAVVNHVPVVESSAILAADGCWNSFTADGLTGTPYRGPLTEVPGSHTYDRLARRGLVAIPLTSIEGLIE